MVSKALLRIELQDPARDTEPKCMECPGPILSDCVVFNMTMSWDFGCARKHVADYALKVLLDKTVQHWRCTFSSEGGSRVSRQKASKIHEAALRG